MPPHRFCRRVFSASTRPEFRSDARYGRAGLGCYLKAAELFREFVDGWVMAPMSEIERRDSLES